MATLETREMGCGEAPMRLRAGGSAMENRTLAALVLEAVRRVEDGEMNPPVNATGAPAFQPRMLLAMLTYCYMIGVYASEDVEAMMYADADFRALCGMEYPDWRRLKRFRRENHPALRRTLQETFRGVWRLSRGARPETNGHHDGARAESSNGLLDPAQEERFASQAQACIERAIFIDGMAAD